MRGEDDMRPIDGWIDGIDGWIDGWMDGWEGGRDLSVLPIFAREPGRLLPNHELRHWHDARQKGKEEKKKKKTPNPSG